MASKKKIPEEKVLKIVEENLRILYFCRATRDDGSPFYMYLALLPSKYPAFLAAMEKKQAIEFEDYGEILKMGDGNEPPEEVKKEMLEKHNFNDDFETQFKNHLINDFQDVKGDFSAKHRPKKRPKNNSGDTTSTS